jgi:hypothetical protein
MSESLMIKELKEAVLQGQPKSIVITHNPKHSKFMQDRICEAFNDTFYLSCDGSLAVDGSLILIRTADQILSGACSGLRGYGVFTEVSVEEDTDTELIELLDTITN